jgi:glycosyltransferase involved in cell wall biosynthesis
MASRVLRRFGSHAHCIAISDAVARDVQSWLPGRPVTTIFNGVDLQRFSPDAPVNERVLDRAAGAVHIGMLATFARWKGQDVFIRAADLVRHRTPHLNLKCYIVGGPIYATTGSQFSEDELRSLASAAGVQDAVKFVPFQDDPSGVYRALDIVVHASTRPEPFGLTIAEAMACGRPVVVCNAGGAAELCTNEEDALTSTPGDAEEMARCIIRLATDPALRERLGRTARNTAVQRFDRGHLGPDLLAVYRSITRQSSETPAADVSPAR